MFGLNYRAILEGVPRHRARQVYPRTLDDAQQWASIALRALPDDIRAGASVRILDDNGDLISTVEPE